MDMKVGQAVAPSIQRADVLEILSRLERIEANIDAISLALKRHGVGWWGPPPVQEGNS